jgi:hypothetical protein
LGIDQDAHRLGQIGDFRGSSGVVGVPSREQFDNPTTMRIVGFYRINPLDRIATTKRALPPGIRAPPRTLLSPPARMAADICVRTVRIGLALGFQWVGADGPCSTSALSSARPSAA